MAGWLTTHYPHPIPEEWPWHVYLQRKHRHAAEGLRVGDLVFFYEYTYHKPWKSGKVFPVGATGIVRVAKVSGPPYQRSTAVRYADNTVGDWCWGVPTDRDIDTSGFVSRIDLCDVMDYLPRYNFHGFNGGTGIKRLLPDQTASLTALFKCGRR